MANILALPAEVRCYIYEYCIPSFTSISTLKSHTTHPVHKNAVDVRDILWLSGICKTMREEFCTFVLHNTTLHLTDRGMGVALETLGHDILKAIKHLTVHLAIGTSPSEGDRYAVPCGRRDDLCVMQTIIDQKMTNLTKLTFNLQEMCCQSTLDMPQLIDVLDVKRPVHLYLEAAYRTKSGHKPYERLQAKCRAKLLARREERSREQARELSERLVNPLWLNST